MPRWTALRGVINDSTGKISVKTTGWFNDMTPARRHAMLLEIKKGVDALVEETRPAPCTHTNWTRIPARNVILCLDCGLEQEL